MAEGAVAITILKGWRFYEETTRDQAEKGETQGCPGPVSLKFK